MQICATLHLRFQVGTTKVPMLNGDLGTTQSSVVELAHATDAAS